MACLTVLRCTPYCLAMARIDFFSSSEACLILSNSSTLDLLFIDYLLFYLRSEGNLFLFKVGPNQRAERCRSIVPKSRVINVVRNRSYPPAVEELKEEGILSIAAQLRRCKYLNNIVEQDHRFIKRRINSRLGFFSFNTARRTIGGYEVMYMVRKGQVEGIGKGDIRGQVRFVADLFNVAA